MLSVLNIAPRFNLCCTTLNWVHISGRKSPKTKPFSLNTKLHSWRSCAMETFHLCAPPRSTIVWLLKHVFDYIVNGFIKCLLCEWVFFRYPNHKNAERNALYASFMFQWRYRWSRQHTNQERLFWNQNIRSVSLFTGAAQRFLAQRITAELSKELNNRNKIEGKKKIFG